MMEQKQAKQSKNFNRRQGQTLAEFALTLPILLLLVFGTIEFGRLFQSWVTIQHVARETTRYTTTGDYRDDIFSLSAEETDPDTGDPNILPCLDGADARGTLYNIPVGAGGLTAEVYAAGGSTPSATNYVADSESLYALFYDGENCQPGPDSDENRKDILRLISIMIEADRVAEGISLSIPDSQQDASTLQRRIDEEVFSALSVADQRETIAMMLLERWETPRPGSQERRYFDIHVCSSRAFRAGESTLAFDGIPGAAAQTRFVNITEDTTFDLTTSNSYINYVVDANTPIFDTPYCALMEDRPAGGVEPTTDNQGLPWVDAGGPGDRVDITVTYNHPLLTPIRVTEFITMRARRSGVNESFRASRALNRSLNSTTGVPEAPTATPSPDVPPVDTNTPTNTDEPTATLTPTHTSTPEPFACDDLGVEFGSSSGFSGQGFVELEIYNYHLAPSVPPNQQVQLTRIDMAWNPPIGYENMFLFSENYNDETLWYDAAATGTRSGDGDFIASGRGQDAPQSANNDLTAAEKTTFNAVNRRVPPLGPPGQQEISYWNGTFFNAPPNFGTVMTPSAFGGTTFYFFDPVSGQECIVPLNVPVVSTLPPDEDNPPNTPSPTYTPNCASDRIGLAYGGFESFGVLRIEVSNTDARPAPLLDFNIDWPDPASVNAEGVLRLQRIVIGGVNADDWGQPDSFGQRVWEGNDLQPDTQPNDSSTTFWNTNYLLPANSTLPIYLDFGGTGTDLNTAFGINLWDFNEMWFNFGCRRGGSGGPGEGPSDDGPVFISTVTPPPATNTPRPTNTPGPTLTPSPIRPTATPGPSRTPAPTDTEAPTVATTPAPPPTFTPVPTDSDVGPVD
jgi:hypothetical protein